MFGLVNDANVLRAGDGCAPTVRCATRRLRHARIRWTALVVVSFGIAASGWSAQAAQAQPQPQPPGRQADPDAPINGDADDLATTSRRPPEAPWQRRPADVERARRILREVRAAYAALDGVRDDDVRMVMTLYGQGDASRLADEQIELILTRDALRFTLVDGRDFEQRYTAIDGTLYAEWDGWPESYAAIDYEDVTESGLNLERLQPVLNRIPIVGLPYVPFMFAAESADPIPMLSMYSINPRLVGIREVQTGAGAIAIPDLDEMMLEEEEEWADEAPADAAEPPVPAADDEDDAKPQAGEPRIELRWESEFGSAPIELSIDPETKLIRAFRTLLRDPGDASLGPDDGMEIVLTLEPSPLPVDEVDPSWFIVTTDDRKDVADFDRLFAGPTVLDLVGEPSPEVVVQPVAGQPGEFRLDDWQGSVVAIVFWSPATEPLFPTLQPIKELGNWVRDEALPVYVLPIAVGTSEGPVRDMWREMELGLSVGVDAEGSLAFETFRVRQLPTVVIVGPDSRVKAVQDGYPPVGTSLPDTLKPMIRKALDPEI